MKAAFSTSLLLLAILCFTSATVFSQEEAKTTDFTEITGKVVDSSNKPIEKFKVNIAIYDYTEGGFQKTPEKLKTWEGEFENGEFSFDVEEPIEIKEKTYLSRTITADGYLDTNRNGSWTLLSAVKGKLAKTKLTQGIKIRGKVVLPDGHEDEKPISPKIYVSKKMKMTGFSPDWNNMFQNHGQVADDGTFEMTVPENIQLIVSAHSANAAAAAEEFKIPKCESQGQEEDLGDIKLKAGVAVTGIVLDQDGNPVEGQVIQSMQSIRLNKYFPATVYGHATSDADGKFKLPPRLGKCDLTLVETGTIDNKQVKAKGEVLMAKPIKLTLKEGVSRDDVEIREGKTWRIHGVISYEGEKPSVNYSFGSGMQNEIELDSDGRFEFEVVEGTTPWFVMYKSGDGTYYEAKLSSRSLKKFRKHFTGSPHNNSQYFQLTKVNTDIGPLEFKMVKHFADTRTMGQMFVDWFYMDDDD